MKLIFDCGKSFSTVTTNDLLSDRSGEITKELQELKEIKKMIAESNSEVSTIEDSTLVTKNLFDRVLFVDSRGETEKTIVHLPDQHVKISFSRFRDIIQESNSEEETLSDLRNQFRFNRFESMSRTTQELLMKHMLLQNGDIHFRTSVGNTITGDFGNIREFDSFSDLKMGFHDTRAKTSDLERHSDLQQKSLTNNIYGSGGALCWGELSEKELVRQKKDIKNIYEALYLTAVEHTQGSSNFDLDVDVRNSKKKFVDIITSTVYNKLISKVEEDEFNLVKEQVLQVLANHSGRTLQTAQYIIQILVSFFGLDFSDIYYS